MGKRERVLRKSVGAAVLVLSLLSAGSASAQIRAGVGVVDASWHVGASAGQYAPKAADDPSHGSIVDPSAHSTTNVPSYGIQSRLRVRAIVVQRDENGPKFAMASTDLYIPQDLLWRRAAQLIAAHGIGIDQSNFVMTITHDHSSPYYTSTAPGAWAFQDVFDIRAYEYWAQQLAAAVIKANASLVPVRVGAAVKPVALANRNALGPARADDGTPAGFPDSYTDRDMSVMRFDSIADPAHPRPLATLVNFGLHPEGLNGNNLISADYIAPLERMVDRETGGVTIWTQNAVGNSEPERSSYHSIHDRLDFTHKEYGQVEFEARRLADQVTGLFHAVGSGVAPAGQENRYVPYFTDGVVRFADKSFGGPLTHPYPSVSNCRTGMAFSGNPQVPVVGLPNCEGANTVYDQAGLGPQNPGPSQDDLKRAGIPVPDNYGALSYGALEESASIHLQAFRIGDVLFTACSCEQWADQSLNIKTRTDRVAGNEWLGFDWATYRGVDDTGTDCFQTPAFAFGSLGTVNPSFSAAHWSCPHPQTAQTQPCARQANGSWSCPDPRFQCLIKGAAFTNTCHDAASDPTRRDSRLTGITDAQMEHMKAQVRNCANGWNSLAFAPYAESEPTDPTLIKGNYTCDDNQRSADLGYRLTIPIAMANDYNGYIATYREYQRGDHYRKALTGWGPHSSDYLATRLIKLGRSLQDGGPPVDRQLDGSPDPDADNPGLDAKVQADRTNNEARAQALGATANSTVTAYEATLPADAGSAEVTKQPADLQRFDASFLQFNGGDNYTDNPTVIVQRLVGGKWQTFADQSGEIPVTVKFPTAGDVPAYAQGNHHWLWTATFEAFVANADLGGPRATPPGTYRYVVDGHRRQAPSGAVRDCTSPAGGIPVCAYRLISRQFRIGPWTGITVDDIRSQSDGTVSFLVGPRHTVPVPGGSPSTTVLGPIDYPDSYDDASHPLKPKFIHFARDAIRDPAAPADPARFEWYCYACTFRPWLDTGDAQRVTVTFARPGTVERVPATLGADGRWHTTRSLRRGESAYVCPSDAQDPFGNFNGEASGFVGLHVTLACAEIAVVGSPNQFGTRPGTVPGTGGTALGLPPSRRCASHRRFAIHVRSPKRGVRLTSVVVTFNGHRVPTVRGRHGRVQAIVVATSLPRGTFTVRIQARGSDGRTYRSQRHYHTCRVRGLTHTPGHLRVRGHRRPPTRH